MGNFIPDHESRGRNFDGWDEAEVDWASFVEEIPSREISPELDFEWTWCEQARFGPCSTRREPGGLPSVPFESSLNRIDKILVV